MVWVAIRSERSWVRAVRCLVTEGTNVSRSADGRERGLKPIKASNGECSVVEWMRELCENSAVAKNTDQLVCWRLQKAQRYCLSSWFRCSVCPSIWGW